MRHFQSGLWYYFVTPLLCIKLPHKWSHICFMFGHVPNFNMSSNHQNWKRIHINVLSLDGRKEWREKIELEEIHISECECVPERERHQFSSNVEEKKILFIWSRVCDKNNYEEGYWLSPFHLWYVWYAEWLLFRIIMIKNGRSEVK